MSVITRQSRDGDGFRHTCLVCGCKWLSDNDEDNRCPRCTSRRIPTTRRLAALMKGADEDTDKRTSTRRRKVATETPSEAGENPDDGMTDDADVNDADSDRHNPVLHRRAHPVPRYVVR